jgi:predicted nucleic acid-binding protein
MIVTDTSAWIEYFRATGSPAAVEVRRLLTDHADQVVMCEPIAMAILSGARDDDKFAMLEQLVNGLPSLAIDDAVDFRAAAAIYRSGRRGGRTIVQGVIGWDTAAGVFSSPRRRPANSTAHPGCPPGNPAAATSW